MTADLKQTSNLPARRRTEKAASLVFALATILAVFSLVVLIAGIVDKSFGFIALEYEVPFESLSPSGITLEKATDAEIISILRENLRPRMLAAFEEKKPLEKFGRKELVLLLVQDVMVPSVLKTWSLSESLFGKASIDADIAENFPDARIEFRAWVNYDFVTGGQSADALFSGIRGAVIGSFLTILITILFAFPIGTAAAIWLEEYASDNLLNRIIGTNIYNLAGVPSIIYGMLGLAVFVRGMHPLTSGIAFGIGDPESASGRTILSASLTLALLILPVIIINAQEALKAVPKSLRLSSLAVGATKWQTIWHHVLPASMDRILTGTVLGVSRAMGETAPLVVVGAAAFLTQDPTSPFSKFTTLPIQIYQWTSYPKEEFRNIAAAAILVLLILLISLNSFAIYYRNRFRKEKRS